MTHTDTHTFHMIIFGFGPCPSNVLLYGCLYKQTSCMFCTHKSQQRQNLQINGLPRKFSSQFLLFSHTPWAKTPSNWNTVETEQISNMYRSRRTNERTNKRFIELGRLPMSNREVGGWGGHFLCINNLSIKTFQQRFSPYTHTHTHVPTHAFTQSQAHSQIQSRRKKKEEEDYMTINSTERVNSNIRTTVFTYLCEFNIGVRIYRTCASSSIF